MKVYFDTNVYVAEATNGRAAAQILDATFRGGWYIYASSFVRDEIYRVLIHKLGKSPRIGKLAVERLVLRADLQEPPQSKHVVDSDPNDTPILRGALGVGAHYLVTGDRHLLSLDPYEGLRIVSLAAYRQLLVNEGLITSSSS